MTQEQHGATARQASGRWVGLFLLVCLSLSK